MRRTQAAFCAVVYSFVAATPVLAGVIRHDVADANYLALGNAAAYAPVGQVTFTNNADWASGVLIGEEWFVTAGHVVRSNFLANTPGNVQFTVGGNTYTANQIVLNPGYVHGQPYNGNDIAIVRLSSSVGNVDPARVYVGADELGELGTIVGFGRTGNGLTGMVASSAAKRGGTNDIDITGDAFDATWSSNVLLSDFDRPGHPTYSSWGSSTPTALEYLIAEKDSGAGLFIEVDGKIGLAGVFAFALFNADGISYGYGDAMAATRVSGHYAWMGSYISDLSTVPEASTLTLISAAILGGALASFRSRRRRNP